MNGLDCRKEYFDRTLEPLVLQDVKYTALGHPESLNRRYSPGTCARKPGRIALFSLMNVLFQDSRSRHLKALLLGTTLLLCLFTAPLSEASDVILIKDSEIKPYRDAIEGFKSTCNCSVKELDLADLDAVERAITAGPDAVVAVGTRAFRRTRAITHLPVIYTMVMPSETTNRRSSNVSGVSMNISPESYLSTIAALFPGAKRIGLLFDPEHSGPFVEQAVGAASAKGVTLVTRKLHDPRQAPELLERMKGKVDILWMLPDATVVNAETIDHLMLFSFRNNIPLFSFSGKIRGEGRSRGFTDRSQRHGCPGGRTGPWPVRGRYRAG